MNKYHNKRVYTSVGRFDSKREYKDWVELQILEKCGKISHLERQKKFDLIDTIRTSAETLRKIVYIADFFYYDNESQEWVVLDSKGFETDIFKLKLRLMLERYPYTFVVKFGKNAKKYKKMC